VKSVLRAILIIVLVPLALFAGHMAWIQMKMYRLRHTDQSRLLSACRQAIANRSSYRNDKDRWGTLHDDDVLLLSPLPADMPAAIRELKPHYVLVNPDYAMINVSLPLSRICILGFRPEAKQFGTFQYIDGLWFWNGNDTTKQKPSP
jgi:hypothetical protein